jgi:hypothetical protein
LAQTEISPFVRISFNGRAAAIGAMLNASAAAKNAANEHRCTAIPVWFTASTPECR